MSENLRPGLSAHSCYTARMPRAPDPRLGTRSPGGLNTLENDRPCGSCGYNLKGLTPGGVCPECGTPIRDRASANEATPELLEAPRGHVQALAAGCFILIGVVVLKYLLALGLALGRASLMWSSAALACIGLLWLVGVVLVTLPRPGKPELAWLSILEFLSRWTARVLALAVPAHPLCVVASEIASASANAAGAPFNPAPWQVATVVLNALVWASYLPLAWTISNLALACADHAIVWRTRAAIACLLWAYGMHGLMFWIRSGTATAGAGVFGLLGVLGWGIGWLIILISLGQIGAMMLWAIRYNDEATDRERRRIEREQREKDRFPAPAPVSPIGPPRPHKPARQPSQGAAARSAPRRPTS